MVTKEDGRRQMARVYGLGGAAGLGWLVGQASCEAWLPLSLPPSDTAMPPTSQRSTTRAD